MFGMENLGQKILCVKEACMLLSSAGQSSSKVEYQTVFIELLLISLRFKTIQPMVSDDVVDNGASQPNSNLFTIDSPQLLANKEFSGECHSLEMEDEKKDWLRGNKSQKVSLGKRILMLVFQAYGHSRREFQLQDSTQPLTFTNIRFSEHLCNSAKVKYEQITIKVNAFKLISGSELV